MRIRDKIALLVFLCVPDVPSLSPCALPVPQGKPTLATRRLGAVCSAGTRTQFWGAVEEGNYRAHLPRRRLERSRNYRGIPFLRQLPGIGNQVSSF